MKKILLILFFLTFIFNIFGERIGSKEQEDKLLSLKSQTNLRTGYVPYVITDTKVKTPTSLEGKIDMNLKSLTPNVLGQNLLITGVGVMISDVIAGDSISIKKTIRKTFSKEILGATFLSTVGQICGLVASQSIATIPYVGAIMQPILPIMGAVVGWDVGIDVFSGKSFTERIKQVDWGDSFAKATGVLIGSSLGSLIPGVGTMIGGTAGGVIGGIIGSQALKLFRKVKKKSIETIQDVIVDDNKEIKDQVPESNEEITLYKKYLEAKKSGNETLARELFEEISNHNKLKRTKNSSFQN